ncbi:P-loop containing nucleoside triphosphate hydrolase [Phytophthora cactorum]|nr:P-loop containing nucleoside triphosphate hydrolase [Phytophthora cactorum]
MSSQVSEAEKTLEDYRAKHNVMALKKRDQGFNRQMSDINREVADIEEIFEGREKPTDRSSILSALRYIDDLMAERKGSLDTKRKEQASAEQRLMENTTSSKLAEKDLNSLRLKKNQQERQHMTGLKELLVKVIPGHDLKNAELGVKAAERAYSDAKDKVVRRKNMVMFLNIYKKKGLKDHCCPLCEPIKEKMPSWRKWLELEAAIPEKAAKSDMEILRKSADELHYSDVAITKDEERTKASQGSGGRSLSDVETEKDAKQAEVQELNHQLQRKQKELDHINEMLQQAEQITRARKTLKEACAKLKKSEPELERGFERKRRNARRDGRGEKQLRAQLSELQERQGDFRVFSDKCKQVQHGELDKLEREVQTLKDPAPCSDVKGRQEKYRHKLIQFETTQMAVTDLDRYFKALDESLLQYHSKKVEEINTIIRSLWQITYKAKISTRLSSETFCLNCGILALDEPTTNLDTENKFGLAQAITDILNARSQQQNFQLVCITHDEEFVQMLSRTQAMEGTRPEFYWRILREDIVGLRALLSIQFLLQLQLHVKVAALLEQFTNRHGRVRRWA